MGEEIFIVPVIFLGLPWIIFHYITKWKTAATITIDDEALLEELYQLAKRLDERMDTVERLVASDNPDFKPARLMRRPRDRQPAAARARPPARREEGNPQVNTPAPRSIATSRTARSWASAPGIADYTGVNVVLGPAGRRPSRC